MELQRQKVRQILQKKFSKVQVIVPIIFHLLPPTDYSLPGSEFNQWGYQLEIMQWEEEGLEVAGSLQNSGYSLWPVLLSFSAHEAPVITIFSPCLRHGSDHDQLLTMSCWSYLTAQTNCWLFQLYSHLLTVPQQNLLN